MKENLKYKQKENWILIFKSILNLFYWTHFYKAKLELYYNTK